MGVEADLAAPDRGVMSRVLRAATAVFVLDGLYVVVMFVLILRRTTVERLFQGIAYAFLGQAAFSGGWSSAFVGVALHFSVALGWSVVWIVAYERSDFLHRATANPIRAAFVGGAYGILVWLAMHFIVLPLTYAKPGPLLNFGSILVGVAHLLVVGPPIVLLERRQ